MNKLIVVIYLFILSDLCFAQNEGDVEFYLRTSKKKIAIVLEASEFKPKDKVADVGCGEGFNQDSLNFYLQDIDSTRLRKEKFCVDLKAFSKAKGRETTCSYTPIIGSEKSTRLPTDYFDKVLLIDIFHHLSEPDHILSDLKRILKQRGKIIVFEVIGRRPGDIYKGCGKVIFTKDQIVTSFTRNGFHIDRIYKTVNSNGKRVRVFKFTRA
jgi:ubiquinone/menaquinone biosynthesis C-methylase UbiE